MNHDIESTERFVAQLRELKPSVPGIDFQSRLEAAIRETKLSTPIGRKIVHHPFFQWSAAAAALLTALLLSFESTEHRTGGSQLSQAPVQPAVTPEVQQMYQLVDGKLIPTVGRSAMMQTAYRGIQVIHGKAYRKFGQGQESFLELIDTEAK